MSFFRRNTEEKKPQYNTEEIKQAVSKPPAQAQTVLCTKHQMPIDNCASLHIQLPSPTYKDTRDDVIPESAPLFVKVEKYKEIVSSVNEVKHFITGIKQLFLVMNELQGIQQDSINMLKISVQRLEKSIEWVDHSLVRPIGFEEPPHGEAEVRQIEQSLSDLQREISNLRKDLEKLS